MSEERTRRLAAVWFADIVGYTALSTRDEDAALEVVDELQVLSRRAVEGKGRVVKFMGDGAMAVFDSANAALESATVLMRAFEGAGTVRRHGCRLSVGVHLGEVVEADDGDIYGDGVNMASRIEGAAGAGQIVMSGAVYQQVRNRSTYDPRPHGKHRLKGVDVPVTLYVLGDQDAGDYPTRLKPSETGQPVVKRRPVTVGLTVAVAAFLFMVTAVAFSNSRGGSPPEDDPDNPALILEGVRPGEDGSDRLSAADANRQNAGEEGAERAQNPNSAATPPPEETGGADAVAARDDDPTPTTRGGAEGVGPGSETAVEREPGNALVVVLYGDGPGRGSAESSILRSIGSSGAFKRAGLVSLDANSLSMVRSDQAAQQAAQEGSLAALAELARAHSGEFMIVGDLRSSARPTQGVFYGASARLELTLYRISTGEVLDTGIFSAGMGGEPLLTGNSEMDARASAETSVGGDAAAAARGWIVRALR